MPRTSLFLERLSYRQRRLMDAVRVLPLVGLAFWMLPLLWPQADVDVVVRDTISTSGALRYLFGVWMGLIFAAWALWLATRAQAVSDSD